MKIFFRGGIKIIISCLLIITSHSVQAESGESDHFSISREQVVAQMNYCINSITNVVHYKSMPLLEHEIDQLLNNLTMEQVVGLYEVQSFRSEMIEKISALQITEEERELMKRVQEMKRENLLYQSIANSLNPTLLLTGGGNSSKQLAFMAIITVARTAVEYKSASNEADIEELQAMWKYRKEDLKNFADLRKDALELVYHLFQKYRLNESERLTEATSTLFSQIIAESDPHTRIRKLLDNYSTFASMADYYYYLGMAYVDAGNYDEGKGYLNRYLALYQKAPIFRYDEKSGCIALTKLALDNNLSSEEIIRFVKIALDNLPNNGPAIIQCALVLNDIGEQERAFNLLRSGIDNDHVSDKDALVMMATELLPDIKSYPLIFEQIVAAIKHCEGLSLNSYIPFLLNSSNEDIWNGISNILQVSNDGRILCDSRYKADISSLYIQEEHHKNESVDVLPCRISYINTVSNKEIQRKFKFLRNEPDQIYICFEPIGSNMFRVKKNLDLQKVRDGDYPGMSHPYISSKDRNKLSKYCKKKIAKQTDKIALIFKADKSGKSITTYVPYADYLTQDSDVAFIDYKNYHKDYSNISNVTCKFKTRENSVSFIPPLRNYPKEIIRIILPGIDTVKLTFFKENGYSLYSVEYNNQEHFKIPYTSTIDEPEKIGWLKRLLRKGKDIGAKATTKIVPEKYDDNVDTTYYSDSVIDGIWKKVLNKSWLEDKDSLATIKSDKSDLEIDKHSDKGNWFRRVWDTICFWKK